MGDAEEVLGGPFAPHRLGNVRTILALDAPVGVRFFHDVVDVSAGLSSIRVELDAYIGSTLQGDVRGGLACEGDLDLRANNSKFLVKGHPFIKSTRPVSSTSNIRVVHIVSRKNVGSQASGSRVQVDLSEVLELDHLLLGSRGPPAGGATAVAGQQGATEGAGASKAATAKGYPPC